MNRRVPRPGRNRDAVIAGIAGGDGERAGNRTGIEIANKIGDGEGGATGQRQLRIVGEHDAIDHDGETAIGDDGRRARNDHRAGDRDVIERQRHAGVEIDLAIIKAGAAVDCAVGGDVNRAAVVDRAAMNGRAR